MREAPAGGGRLLSRRPGPGGGGRRPSVTTRKGRRRREQHAGTSSSRAAADARRRPRCGRAASAEARPLAAVLLSTVATGSSSTVTTPCHRRDPGLTRVCHGAALTLASSGTAHAAHFRHRMVIFAARLPVVLRFSRPGRARAARPLKLPARPEFSLGMTRSRRAARRPSEGRLRRLSESRVAAPATRKPVQT
jgi:hypothetical protein